MRVRVAYRSAESRVIYVAGRHCQRQFILYVSRLGSRRILKLCAVSPTQYDKDVKDCKYFVEVRPALRKTLQDALFDNERYVQRYWRLLSPYIDLDEFGEILTDSSPGGFS